MNTLWTIGKLVLILLALTHAMLFVWAQTPEPLPTVAPPAEIRLQDLPETDRLRIQNLYLQLDAIQSNIQRLQTEFGVIRNTQLPALIGQMQTKPEFNAYDFDYTTVSFKLKIPVKNDVR